jgi:hypothetical protein
MNDKFDASMYRILVKLCGSTADGSDTTVNIFQDDATRTWILRIGSTRTFHGRTLAAALYEANEFYAGD